MDRLISGDVGYGKTEIAVRAAFKAVQDGKQVAVLVPTTVLAQQHYRDVQRALLRIPGAGGAAARASRPPRKPKETHRGRARPAAWTS